MDFMFDGERLSDWGYMICYDGANEEELPVSSMVYDTIKASFSDVVHKVAHNYEENYSRTFAIMKSPCDDQDYYYLTESNIASITRWLVRKQYKIFRYIDDDAETPHTIWYKAQNTINKIYYGDKVIGLNITVNTNAPYGFKDEIVEAWDTDSQSVSVSSDEEGYIYPNLTITCSEAGNLTIRTNRESGRITRINNVVAGEVITITGGDIQQISSSVTDHDLGVDFNYVFPRLIVKYNNRTSTVTTNLASEKTLSYCGIRKVGL